MNDLKSQRPMLRLLLSTWLILLLLVMAYSHITNPHTTNPYRLIQFVHQQTFKMHSSLRARFRDDSLWMSKADLSSLYAAPEIIAILEASHASPATLAIQRNDILLAHWAVEHEVDLNRIDSTGRVPLTYLNHSSDEIIEIYLDAGALAHVRNPITTRRLLFYAIQVKNLKAVQRLIEQNANPRRLDDHHHYNALHVAAMYPDPQIMEYLIKIPDQIYPGQTLLNPDIPESRTHNTPLHLLLRENHLKSFKMVLDSFEATTLLLDQHPHLNLNARNRHGLTPTHLVIKNHDLLPLPLSLKGDNYVILGVLHEFSERIDFNIPDKKGRSALMYCLLTGDWEAIERGIIHMHSFGADPQLKDYEGKTLLHFAAQKEAPVSIIKLLLTLNIDPKITDNDQKTFLDYASPQLKPEYEALLSSMSETSTPSSTQPATPQ